METVLVSIDSVRNNLRRSARNNLLSSLSIKQFNNLALKYFGIYENGKLVGYQCPYSGEKITDAKRIELEHIIPISAGGGTTLFNCIPVSKEVNKRSEKGTKHLVSWWLKSKYWDDKAPERLERLIQYMLEAYDITFNNQNQEYDFTDSIDDSSYDVDLENEEADLSTTQEEEQQVKSITLITYYTFIKDLINQIKEYTDVSRYETQLQNLVNQNIFNNIERQLLIQNYLKEIIKRKLESEDRSELTVILNIDIRLLANSLEIYSDNKLYDELEKRIDNLESLLDSNNLSLYSLFMDKNSLSYLYKDINDLTQEDIKELINNANMNVNDKFKSMVDFVLKNNGVLPSTEAKDEKEKTLGRFRNSIQHKRQNESKFFVYLTNEQLKYLHDSEFESLREIYKVILNKSIENDIEIAYIDEQMKFRILEFREKNKLVTSLEEQIILENEYSDVLLINSQFNQFIVFVLKNNGVLPKATAKGEKEKKLGVFRSSLQKIKTGRNIFHVSLTSEQLKYLHDSEFESLREIYKVILNKSIENDIEIAYIDEQMKFRILEFREKNKLVTSLEEQIILENEYSDVLLINSQFNQFIDFVLKNNGILPRMEAINENEKRLGIFRNNIQQIYKNRSEFVVNITKEQLEYLHDSEFESLREMYNTIIDKAMSINYQPYVEIDSELKSNKKGRLA